VRPAFDESLRWDSPSRMAGRITMQDVEIEGVVIPRGERCGLMFAAANRDPRKWVQPERFDVRRDNRGHLGWGQGIHACVGRVLAGLEADALLGAVARIECLKWPESLSPDDCHRSRSAKLPVRFTAASRGA
jgi:cytochrome P450